jgi:hypothetical protein
MIDDNAEMKAYSGKRREAQKMMRKCRKLHVGNMMAEELK